jgi:membrane protease YdiL (CAAX protease family)
MLIAAYIYSRAYPGAYWIWTAALPAFFFETLFYFGSILESTRELFARLSSMWTQAGLLFASALLPYLIFSTGAATFNGRAFALLAELVAVLTLWYVVLPRRSAYDFGFLVIAAAPVLLRVFRRIYVLPDTHVRLDILGHLMWIRVALIALLVLRRWDAGPVGLWPRQREWHSGILWFLLTTPPLVAVALLIHDVSWVPLRAPWWREIGLAAGTFFGVLWVVALSEELFFRGVVQRALLNRELGPALAITVSTLLYACAHLWFHEFPDWRQATVAGILGVGCGVAYWRTGSIRASMVTHAFAVTTWRVFFR